MASEPERFVERLLDHRFEFGPCKTVVIDGECLNCRDAVDLVVQKALALLLTPLLEPTVDRHCYHLEERGGCKAAVMHMEQHARHYLRSED